MRLISIAMLATLVTPVFAQDAVQTDGDALNPFKRSLILPDGKTFTREFKTGDVMWSEAQTHIGENIGQTPTRVVIVELKNAKEGCPKQ